jgi:hypothetical protein
MATLHLYLTDGFKDDRVAVSVDGRKVFDEGGVTTKRLIGLAKQLGPITVPGIRRGSTSNCPKRD